MSYVLAIDYGTSFTCAAVSAHGRAEILRVQSDSHMPSSVFLDDNGRLLVGGDAINRAATAPERFERSPKRQLGLGTMVLGDVEVDPVDAVAAVLRAVLTEAERQHNGEAPSEVRLTHPARWGDARRALLVEAAARAGLEAPVLLEEPVAAAHHFAHSPSVRIESGDRLAVYDLGGGTFDTAVLRCTGPDRFELAGPPGGTADGREGSQEIGGDVFDHRVYTLFGRQIEENDAAAWSAMRKGETGRDRKARRILREDARKAKEQLSSTTSAETYVERADLDVLITREQFTGLIEADVAQTIEILQETLDRAGVAKDDLAALFLTGGSSRIPLIEERVRRHFGRADTQDDPKAIVALGAVAMTAPTPAVALVPDEESPTPPATQPQPQPGESVTVPPAEPRRRLGGPPPAEKPWWQRGAGAGALAAAALFLIVGVAAAAGAFSGTDTTDPTPTPTSTSTAEPTATQTPEPTVEADSWPEYEAASSCAEAEYIRVNSVTTCEFAANVIAAYEAAEYAEDVEAYSPALNETIPMSCTGDLQVTCTGGNDAVVYAWYSTE